MHQFVGASGESGGITQEAGVKYIPSLTAQTDMEVTADKIRKIKDNVYARGLLSKLKNLIFCDVPNILVTNEANESDDTSAELQTKLMAMFNTPDVNLAVALDQAFTDRFLYGGGIFNPVWQNVEGEIAIVKLNHLPAFTFAFAPKGVTKVYSFILRGIVLDDKGVMQFWQSDEMGSNQVNLDPKSLFFVKDPSDEELAGTSIVMPIVPFIEMLNYTWNGQMQQVNRIGAPIMFIKVTSPRPANKANGMVSDIDYANLVLQFWGKDNAYPLRDNMEVVVPNVHEGNVSLETIDALTNVILDYISPSSFISRGGATLIGGSALSEAQIMDAYIEGVHRTLENAFGTLVNYYLLSNGWAEKGYRATVDIPYKGQDKSALRMQQALVGFNTQTFLPNEVRENLEREGLSDEDMAKLAEYYKSSQPQPTGFGQPSQFTAMENVLQALTFMNQAQNVQGVTASTDKKLSIAVDSFADDLMATILSSG